MAKDNTNRDTTGGRICAALAAGWSTGGAESFGVDGGEAATESARQRHASQPDLATAISRGLIATSYLGPDPQAWTDDGLRMVARRVGMDVQFGEVAALRLAADLRLLDACERGVLAHVGVGHKGTDPNASVYAFSIIDCPATALTLVQAEVCCGIRDFDGEYAGPFAALRWTCAGVDGAA